GQIAGLGRLLWAGRRRGELRAISDFLGREFTGNEPPSTPERREFVEKRNDLVVAGCSEKEWIMLIQRGWTDWDVKLEPGVLEELSQEEFEAELVSAAGDLMEDYTEQMAKLRHERKF
ncbi:MAG: hypothetical protein ACRDXX_06980, partial [Stackebrandtia sp.]